MSLLIWKLSLTIFGSFEDAHHFKNQRRQAEGLPLLKNPMETINCLERNLISQAYMQSTVFFILIRLNSIL